MSGGYPALRGVPLPGAEYATITIINDCGAGVEITSERGLGQLHMVGALVTVRAMPGDSLLFVEWRDESGVVLSEDAEYSFVMTGNVTLTLVCDALEDSGEYDAPEDESEGDAEPEGGPDGTNEPEGWLDETVEPGGESAVEGGSEPAGEADEDPEAGVGGDGGLYAAPEDSASSHESNDASEAAVNGNSASAASTAGDSEQDDYGHDDGESAHGAHDAIARRRHEDDTDDFAAA
jgi:hypothetical protein